MKPKLSAILLAATLVLSGCSANNAASMPQASSSAASSSAASSVAETPKAKLPDAISKTVSGVTISVDPLMELLATVQFLSDYDETYGLLTGEITSYHDDLEAAFRQYEGHEAVTFFNDAMQNGFSFDSPPTACLYLDQSFAIRPEFEGSDYQRNRLSTGMEQFRTVMEQFYLDTDFATFFDAHQDYYSRMIDRYAENFPSWNMIETMEAYYGKTMAGYNIILVPLFHPGGFGPSLEFADGTHIYSIQGPYEAKDDTPLYGNSEDIANLVLHEFGHSFVPINEEDDATMMAEVKRSEYLMEAVRDEMTRNAYPRWMSAYEELALRAAVIDLMMTNTQSDLEELLQYERDTGFLYIDCAYETVQQYSKNRETYPTFDAFVPVMTDALIAAYPEGAKAA